ncbi:unnamed protein product [Psylliodes chrysocephalus]|uniref:Uncharacterized protein n=1 Tax=Psylliodes chrysocephalus TaxID=3402493 RepID=A0A9P0GGB0_9CUCU|nr:unnamed protein product [Psylliodes chrysocephala]
MDIETEPGNENDTSREQMKTSNDKTTPEKPKETHNHKNTKSKRSSRSRTPQKKLEDPKVLHMTLKRMDEELNGKKVKEEKMESRNGESQKIENGEKLEDTEQVEDKEQVENGEKVGKEEKVVKGETFIKGEKVVKGDQVVKGEKVVKGKKVENGEKSPKVDLTKETENGEPAKIETVRESTSEAENDLEKPIDNGFNGFKEVISTEPEKPGKQDSKETVEMDPLVISDEIDAELQFLEENSDKDSGKGSPLMTRCATRRSYTRNIPTPKTPKLPDQETDSEKNSTVDQSEEICNLPNDIPIPKTDNPNDTKDSLDTENASIKVEVGSDSTRLDFSEINNSTEHDLSYLNSLRDRGLSSRRPIRGSEDYRKRVLKNTYNKSDLNILYDEVSTGVKRKNRSMTPEDSKKIRIDSPGYRTFFTSPFASIKNKFKTDVQSSTPELLGYKDDRSHLHFNDNLDLAKIEEAGDEEKKSWCSLM